jgi:tetratricopeptide repeat protein
MYQAAWLLPINTARTAASSAMRFRQKYRHSIRLEPSKSRCRGSSRHRGPLKTRRQQLNEAEAEYRTALRVDPKFVPAMVNLADLDRQRGQDKEGAELLRAAIAIQPNNAAIKHSLGLLLVRQRNAHKEHRARRQNRHTCSIANATRDRLPQFAPDFHLRQRSPELLWLRLFVTKPTQPSFDFLYGVGAPLGIHRLVLDEHPAICAANLTHLISLESGLDIIINVPFTPDVVDSINAKARKQGLSGPAWISMTVENALQLQKQVKEPSFPSGGVDWGGFGYAKNRRISVYRKGAFIRTISPRNEILVRSHGLPDVVADATIDWQLGVVIEQFHRK